MRQTQTTPRPASLPPGLHCSGFDTTLPLAVRAELLERTKHLKPTVDGRSKLITSRRRDLMQRLARSAVGLALFLVVPVAFITAAIMAFSELSRHVESTASSPPSPVVQTPVVQPAVGQTPPQQFYREWVAQAGGWVLTNAQCVPLRGTFIADPAPRAQPATPRAELVSMPVRRATLVNN
jgi:hypothetical protein